MTPPEGEARPSRRRESKVAVLCALICAALGGSSVHAEGQGVRRGGWLEGSVGTGTVRNGCAGCDGVTVGYGGTDYVRAGGAFAPRVLVGLEFFTLAVPDLLLDAAPVDAKNRSVGPIVMWYVGSSGVFLRGGVGLARADFSARSTAGEIETVTRTGSSLTFGFGFDIGLVRWLALTASLGTNIMAVGDVDIAGSTVRDLIATAYEVGVGLTLR